MNNPRIFFPPNGGGSHAYVEKAKAYCARCVVREDCLEHALTHSEQWGIWGGMTEKQRRGERARRYRAARAASRAEDVA